MRYVCTGCGNNYGEGINKPQRGYCSQCWDNFLAACREKSGKLMAEWEAREQPERIPQAIPKYPFRFRWLGLRWFLLTLANRINAKVCKWLKIPTRRNIFPRIRLQLRRD